MSSDEDTKSGVRDFGQTLKDSFRESDQAFDVIRNGNSFVPHKFNRIELDTDINDIVRSIRYYNDEVSEITKITFVSDILSSLAGKSYVFYTGLDRTKYYIYYKVNGVGVDPAIADATGILVNLQENDDKTIVAFATKNAIAGVSNSSYFFNLDLDYDNLLIENIQGGLTTDSADIDTSFTFETKQDGASNLVGILDIEYDVNDNVVGVTRY